MLTKEAIEKRLIQNRALFNNIFVFEQQFDILPNSHPHFGAAIAYQDIEELRDSFLKKLEDTIPEWIYGLDKYKDLMQKYIKAGDTVISAASEIQRKAKQKFRRGNNNSLLIQGQLGELLLFHFIQRIKGAVPLLRKMPITTSSDLERHGADAIHYNVDENGKSILYLGEAKAYTSKYRFAAAFGDALDSILSTYDSYRHELNLYLHEDFLDSELNEVAEAILTNTLQNYEVHLVSLILYCETSKIMRTTQSEIQEQILSIISKRYGDFDNNRIDIIGHPILHRITYIVFPVWEFEQLAIDFQKCL